MAGADSSLNVLRSILKWAAVAVAVPLLLVLTAAVLLYVPAIQDWAVKEVMAVASEKTGMDISVGKVRLKWPLRLGITDFCAIDHGDTLAAVKQLAVTVRLRPILSSRIMIGSLDADNVSVNTASYLSDISIAGKVEKLWLTPDSIDLRQQVMGLGGAELSGAFLTIALSDTAAVDTTETEPLEWLIKADSIAISRSHLTLALPGDTLSVGVGIGRVVARQLLARLADDTYSVGSFDWDEGSLSYDNRLHPLQEGFDAAHIQLSDMAIRADSIFYGPQGTSLNVRHAAMKEKCGLDVQDFAVKLSLDSAFSRLSLPHVKLRTADSDIMAEAEVPLSSTFWSADATQADLMQTVRLRLNATVGKQDLTRFAGSLPQKMMERYPNHPLTLRGSVEGNMEHLRISGLDANLPSSLHLNANGTIDHLSEVLSSTGSAGKTIGTLNKLRADIRFNAEGQNLDFLVAMLPKDISSQYAIPHGMTLNGTVNANGRLMQTKFTADIPTYGKQTASTTTGNLPQKRRNNGRIEAEATYNTATSAYKANIQVDRLNVKAFMPHDSLGLMTATVHIDGQGTDLLSPKSRMDGSVSLTHLTYGHWELDSIKADVSLKNGNAEGRIVSHNQLLDGIIDVTAKVNPKHIDAVIKPDVAKADIFRMRLSDKELAVGMSGTVEISSDMKQQHQLRGRLGGLWLNDGKRTYQPEDIGLFVSTRPDTTWIRAQSGNLIVKLDATGGYERLMAQAQTLMDTVMAQYNNKVIDQLAVKRQLPNLKLHVSSGRDNPLANILRLKNIEFKELLIDLNTSPLTGINGQAHLYSLVADSTRIDTIRLNLTQKDDRLTYQGQVTNNKRNPQFVFNALIDGHVHQHGALAGLRYWDKQGRMGLRLGATVEMESGGLRVRFLPERPTIGYKEFVLNKDNYIFLANDNHIVADVKLVADDGTGLKLYSAEREVPVGSGLDQADADTPSVDADEGFLLDLTLSLNRFNLGELTSVLPYMPKMTGLLGGDFHIMKDSEKHISIASDLAVQEMTYEGSPIGNLSTELVYLNREDDGHAIEARLMLDDEEFGLLTGTYWQNNNTENSNRIDATFQMTRLPLSLANGFVPDQLIGLDGYGEGTLTIKGSTSQPVVDGEIMLDSAYLVSVPYGIRMRFDDDPVRIAGSHLLLENFGLYAYNEEPLNIMADIDFSNTDKVKMDMRMRARNLLLINTRQEAQSVAFGKAYVNFYARMNGPLDGLQMRGRLDVLGSTDLTYMLLDSPLSTDNRLDELVKFTDFSDTTQTASISRPAPSGLDMDLTISVSQGAHIVCDLNVEQTNYVDLLGGGELRMRYGADGLTLRGRYTLDSGEMKYSMPVIPLKTFTIQDGSYVEFTGDPMNPRLNITATERVKATVAQEGTQSRGVDFDCGVVITKTLSDMGLQFIISAPEDNTVNSELQAMSAEERGKLAVTMLTTGMYLADGNTSGFSMNSALSSFLQSEINNITGSALKTLDLSVGLDNATDASGQSYTDYSFKFSKRLFDNRLKIQLGGKVSTGNEMSGQKQSFFDNITMEYRLDHSAQKNVKLYYQQNVYDWLEGYTGMYGGGFVWRKKMDSFWDMFKFKSTPPPSSMGNRQSGSRLGMSRDSIGRQQGSTTDSIGRQQGATTDSISIRKGGDTP